MIIYQNSRGFFPLELLLKRSVLMVIIINKSPNADSRTADKNTTFEEFSKATDMHRDDVKRTMEFLSGMILQAGENHDWTKKEKEKEFYDQFRKAIENGRKFTKSDWYKYHITKERHHILAHCPDDVNLIDVLEMISDCCCAGLARQGFVREVTIPPDILMNAFKNTVELVKNSIKVED